MLVAPLLRMAPAAMLTRVSLSVKHDGQSFILTASELGAIDRRAAGAVRGSLAAYEDDIRRALDRLFTGF